MFSSSYQCVSLSDRNAYEYVLGKPTGYYLSIRENSLHVKLV